MGVLSETAIYLVRHGAHDLLGRRLCGVGDPVGLNEAGKTEALAAARRVCAQPVGAILTSPAVRTRETAAIIGEACGLSPEVEPSLAEIEFGRWDGRSFIDLANDGDWKRWNADRGRARPPGGETTTALLTRVAAWLDTIRQEPMPTVAVTHADVIKAMVCHVLGLGIHFHDRFQIDSGSVTTLILGGGGMRLQALNEASA